MSKNQTKKSTESKEAAKSEKKSAKPKTKGSDEKQDIGDYPNMATFKANLSFNVNTFKQWLKGQFEIMPPLPAKAKAKKPAKDQKAKDDEEDGEEEKTKSDGKLKINGAHIALAAANETLCNMIIKETISYLPKEKTGLYVLGRSSLTAALQMNNEMLSYYFQSMKTYDADTNFGKQYCVAREDIRKYVSKNFGENIDIDATGFNLLAYLLIKFSSQISKTACLVISYAKKTMLDAKSIYTAVKICCPDAIANPICMRIEDAVKNSGEQKDEKEDKETKETNDDKEDNEDEKPSKGKKAKKKTDDDEEDEEEKKEEEDKEDEEDEQEEEEEKPKKKSAKNKD